MATEVQICNLALSHIGMNTIQSLDENTTIARACKLHYEVTRDSVLRDHAWSFAKRQATLALSTETVDGWDYAYAYPTDCLNALEIYDEDGSISGTYYDPETGTYQSSEKVEFEIVSNTALSQRLVVTDLENAVLIYTAKVTTPNMFDSIFMEALSLALAVKLVAPLKADKALQNQLEERYIRLMNRAKAVSANEEHKKPDNSNNTFVNAR